MSCTVNFDKTIGFDCIQDIILDVRNGKITVDTVKKGLWALGCSVEFFSPRQLIGDSLNQEEKTMEQLCDELEAALPAQGFGSEEEDKAGNPLVWISLASLIWQVIVTLRNRNK